MRSSDWSSEVCSSDLVTLNHEGELLSRKPVNERIRYTLISNPQYVLEPQLDARARTRLTRLPKGRDPRTIALAQGRKDQGRSDAAIVAAALNMIRPKNRTGEPQVGKEGGRHCRHRGVTK